MNNKELSIANFQIDDIHDEKINESLLSLRFMKQIDDYLETYGDKNKDLASKLQYSESYVSQLMTGCKNVNVSFLNKVEQLYDVYFEIKLIEKKVVKIEREKKENNWTILFSDDVISDCDYVSLESKKGVELKANVKSSFFIRYEEIK